MWAIRLYGLYELQEAIWAIGLYELSGLSGYMGYVDSKLIENEQTTKTGDPIQNPRAIFK